MTRPVCLAITGPTTSGKTSVSLAVAARIPAELVSMDSRQVYRGMDIGTDKVRAQDRGDVPHHGLDLVDPNERYSAGHFARDARRWVKEIRARGRLPILVGGTGFFLKAVVDPIFAEPELDDQRRASLRAYLAAQPRDRLVRWVEALDPVRAELAVEGGPQRMSRTIEVALLSGVPLSTWHQRNPQDAAGLPAMIVVLDLPREELDLKIDARVTRMVDDGLLDEVRGLLARGYSDKDPGMSGTGYREMAAHLRGEMTLNDAMDEMRKQTRQYARRQLTWFRNQLPDGALTVDASLPAEEQADTIVAEWRQAMGASA